MKLESHLANAFFIAGPTGCGKSKIAVELAERTGGEIVNADAFQLYRGIGIITAQPSLAEQERVPHHLYGVVETSETFHAARYRELAAPVIAEISQRGRIPLVTGGSGLYLKALTHGLNEAPAADPDLRRQLDELSVEELLAELQTLDPEAAERIDPKNRRYVQRALEITKTTGRPSGESRQAWEDDDQRLRGIFLNRPRSELRERIEQRVVEMFQQGAVEEVLAIETWSETSRKAIGVPEILELEDREACMAAIQQASRRFAKRQRTWFRREAWLTEVDVSEQDAVAVATRLLGGGD